MPMVQWGSFDSCVAANAVGLKSTVPLYGYYSLSSVARVCVLQSACVVFFMCMCMCMCDACVTLVVCVRLCDACVCVRVCVRES